MKQSELYLDKIYNIKERLYIRIQTKKKHLHKIKKVVTGIA